MPKPTHYDPKYDAYLAVIDGKLQRHLGNNFWIDCPQSVDSGGKVISPNEILSRPRIIKLDD